MRFSLKRNQPDLNSTWISGRIFCLFEYPDDFFYLNGYLDGIFNIWTVLNLKSHLFTNFHNSIVCTAQINFGGKNVHTVLIDINKQISTRATIKCSSNHFYRLFRSIYLFWWWFWLLFLSINGVQMKFFSFFYSEVDLEKCKGMVQTAGCAICMCSIKPWFDSAGNLFTQFMYFIQITMKLL